jgi:hypothetical protein
MHGLNHQQIFLSSFFDLSVRGPTQHAQHVFAFGYCQFRALDGLCPLPRTALQLGLSRKVDHLCTRNAVRRKPTARQHAKFVADDAASLGDQLPCALEILILHVVVGQLNLRVDPQGQPGNFLG